jgi:hypothetical protein
MAISARCPACGKDYQLADEQAGQRVRCRVCRWEFDVPGRVEALETVPLGAVSARAANGPRSPLYEPLGPPAPRKGRKWRYVVGGLAAAAMLLFLFCGGGTLVLVQQTKKAVAQIEQQQNAKVDAALKEAKNANDRADKERDRADKEKDKADKARDDAKKAQDKADPKGGGEGGVRVAEGGGGKGVGAAVLGQDELLARLKGLSPEDLKKAIEELGLKGEQLENVLAKLKELGDIARVPTLTPVKDVDDCVARLRSKNQASRLSAIKWIGEKQSFPDPQEKKKVIDALAPLAEENGPLKKDAVFWKLALELDP